MKSQTRLSVRSINQSNRSISVRLSSLFCSRAFISRSYENRSTTMYCVGESVDQVPTTLNKALEELALWCKHNSLVPHPNKCEGMILKRNHFIGPLGSLKINQHFTKWSSSSKLLGVTIDTTSLRGQNTY